MPAPRPLYIHVGLQKTGTSYLQSIFWHNQDRLADLGLDLVPGSKRATFHLMLRVRDRYNPSLDPGSVASALDRLPRELAKAPGARALISQESLAACTPAQIEALLSACTDREVHVILTVRDLGRQLPSAWQQTLQSAESLRYDTYLKRLQRRERSGRFGLGWIHLSPPAVLARWAAFLPPERLHVVTVPPPGSDPSLLLQRYCQVLGMDHARLSLDVAARNTGLGRVQAEVLRRVNAGLDPRLRRRQVYGDLGKRFFAVQVLGAQERRRTKVPAAYEQWVREVSQSHIETLRAGGYDVVGDLMDLESHPSAFSADEREPRQREVAASAVAALVRMLTLKADGRGARAPVDEAVKAVHHPGAPRLLRRLRRSR